MASSAVAGLLLAIFLVGVRDLRSGIVYERWQILRQLDLPVLGEVGQS
jgi:capsular polysaccharide biosynthesis protein